MTPTEQQAPETTQGTPNPAEPTMTEITVQTSIFDLDIVDYVVVERKQSYKTINNDADFNAAIPDNAIRLEMQRLGYETWLRRLIKAATDKDASEWTVKATGQKFAGTQANDKAFNDTVNALSRAAGMLPTMTADQKREIRESVIEDIKASPRIIAQLKKASQTANTEVPPTA